MFDLSKFDLTCLPPQLLGRLSFAHAEPTHPQLPPRLHDLGIDPTRDYHLFVPSNLPKDAPIPLWVMFHGASGSAKEMLSFLQEHAEREKFLLLVPHSMLVTWDLAVGGNGPDLDRLDRALTLVASHFALDASRIAFAGFSDGGSYALSIGLTNGRFVTHVFAFSAGFMNLYAPEGKPLVFVYHGDADKPLPAPMHGRRHAASLEEKAYEVAYVEYAGGHEIAPDIVAQAVAQFVVTR